MKNLVWVIIGLALVFAFLGSNDSDDPYESPIQPVIQINMTSEMAASVTAHIIAAGYNCPLAKLAYAEGEDQYGTVTQVYCGPRDQSGVYENAVFRVTIRPNNSVIVRPWRD